jgi:hypothetical protein
MENKLERISKEIARLSSDSTANRSNLADLMDDLEMDPLVVRLLNRIKAFLGAELLRTWGQTALHSPSGIHD